LVSFENGGDIGHKERAADQNTLEHRIGTFFTAAERNPRGKGVLAQKPARGEGESPLIIETVFTQQRHKN